VKIAEDCTIIETNMVGENNANTIQNYVLQFLQFGSHAVENKSKFIGHSNRENGYLYVPERILILII
jgi:hypothetical protein